MKNLENDLSPIGYNALIKQYDLRTIPHHQSTYIIPTGRGSSWFENKREIVVLSAAYALDDPKDPFHHLEFALKHEGVNLGILASLFSHLNKIDLQDFILKTPTGKYTRIIWFLYEYLTKDILDLPDSKNTPYVDVLDSKKYYVQAPIKSKRHAVNNNLLGYEHFCPIVRKTKVIANYEKMDLSQQARALIKKIDPRVLARATNFLYTKETKSSFAIEKVKPDLHRTHRFVKLLEDAHNIKKLSKDILVKLQNVIVDENYQDHDYRVNQNYVGEVSSFYTEIIHYISPKPEDLPLLMTDFLKSEEKLFSSDLNPVIIATILSFAFVFIHPFEDGNGRIHRFIAHYALSKTKFTPNNLIFPISAVILKNIKQYDEILETFSKPLMQVIRNYELNDKGELTVADDTKQLYQYIDYTQFVEYLFSCIQITIEHDFPKEVAFIIKYDRTKSAIQAIVDMPDNKIDRIIRCIVQNNGQLGKRIRGSVFAELSDTTIIKIESAVNKEMS